MILDMHENQNYQNQNHTKTKTISKPKLQNQFWFCYMPISGRRKSEPPCNRKRFDAHRLFLYILKRARKWTRRGEESESEGTD